jgi:hypothetical protein
MPRAKAAPAKKVAKKAAAKAPPKPAKKAKPKAAEPTARRASVAAASPEALPPVAVPPPPAPAPQPEPVRASRVVAAQRLESRDIDSLSGEPLKAYARSIGIPERDVVYLTEDRLRQNCKAHVAHHIEFLTED